MLNIIKPTIIQKNKVNFESILELFVTQLNNVICVTDNDDNFYGIVTLGDFFRSKKEEIIINTACKTIYSYENVYDKFLEIKKNNNRIDFIPVLNEKKQLIYAIKKDNKQNYSYLQNFCYIMLENIDCLTFESDNKSTIGIYSKNFDLAIQLHYLLRNKYKDLEFKIFLPFDSKHGFSEVAQIYYESNITYVKSIKDFNIDLDILFTDDDIQLKLFSTFLKCKLICLRELLEKSISNAVRKEAKNQFLEFSISLKEKDITFYTVGIPDKLCFQTKNEKERASKGIPQFSSNTEDKHINIISKKYIDDNTFDKFYFGYKKATNVIKCGDLVMCNDITTQYVNIQNGKRKNIFEDKEYENNIYIFGSCAALGLFSTDEDTIGNILQKLCLNNDKFRKYKVTSYGCVGCHYNYYKNWLKYLKLNNNDIIIFVDFLNIFEKVKIDIDMTRAFNELHKCKEFFWDKPIHCNYDGYECIANEIYKHINSCYRKKEVHCHIQESTITNALISNNELEYNVYKYLKNIVKVDSCSDKRIVGSIVMNCNPFTLGHRYIITEALKMVDYLYVFVLEENKSYFSFEDRIRLVREGTKDLKNVIVNPSGKFILSSFTFPEYFSKDTDNEAIINSEKDIGIFGKYIANYLNIKIRFLGEEPLDKITKQYNDKIEEILPQYGIDVKIIKRKMEGKEVISAKRVRKALDNKDFETIKKLVPETTYNYLINYK